MSILRELARRQVADPPAWLTGGLQYETVTGSEAYGLATAESDRDLIGFAVPPEWVVFPHLAGEIPGFGKCRPRFEQYQKHHLDDGTTRYDVVVYNVVKFFQLAMENNPNILVSLFTPPECVTHKTPIGSMVRDQRRLFLHKGLCVKFQGYAASQLHKLTTKRPTGVRAERARRHGYDTKYAYHVVRLLLEAEQLLTTGDLDVRQHRDTLAAVRAGAWPESELRAWAGDRDATLTRTLAESPLPDAPQEAAIRQLLLDCLGQHYGHPPGRRSSNEPEA